MMTFCADVKVNVNHAMQAFQVDLGHDVCLLRWNLASGGNFALCPPQRKDQFSTLRERLARYISASAIARASSRSMPGLRIAMPIEARTS